MDTSRWRSGKEPEIVSNAGEIYVLIEEIRRLVHDNISPEGQCRFDSVRTKLALELVKHEIEKSIRQDAD